MKKYDAIVVGSGIGGMAAGVLMAHQGKKVLMVEKHDCLGGRVSAYKKGEFNFDLGVHIISRGNKGPLGEVLRRVGAENNLEYTNVRPLSSYDGKTFIFPHDLATMVPEEDFLGVKQFLKDIRSYTDEEVAQFDTVTVKDVLHKYTKNPLACSCIWMVCAVYTCLPYWEASAGEFMRCLRWESAARASGYPEGGCQAITDTYSKAFTKLGGEIMLNAPVEKAVVKDGKVVGVIVNGEEIDCDMMVYNGDIKTAVNKVIGAEHFDKEYVDYVNALKYSWGGTTVKLAVDGHLTDLKMLSQFGTLDQEKFYEDLAKGIIPEEVNFFMSNPSNYSKSAAPEGKQMICFTCPHQLDLPEEIEARLVDKMMVTAEKYIPGLSEHIIIKEVLFNSDIMTASGKGGAGIGIGQVAGQTGAYRPKIKLPVEGAYVVGAAAGGAGVGWGATRDNPLARGQKPLDTDVFSDGGASRLPENAPQLRCAQEKRAADGGQGNVLKKMQIDVLQNLLRYRHRLIGGGGGGFGEGAKCIQNICQNQQHVNPQMLRASRRVKFRKKRGEFGRGIVVLPAERLFCEDAKQKSVWVEPAKHGRRKMHDDPLIRLRGKQLELVRLSAVHDQQLSGMQGIDTSFHEVLRVAGKKVENLHPLVRVHVKF